MDTVSGLDQLVMLAAFRQHPNAYGVSIKEELLASTSQDYAIGTIYTALERLERKGLLRPRQGEPEEKRGGRAKLFFELTGRGRMALQASLQAIDKMRVGFDAGPVPAYPSGVA